MKLLILIGILILNVPLSSVARSEEVKLKCNLSGIRYINETKTDLTNIETILSIYTDDDVEKSNIGKIRKYKNRPQIIIFNSDFSQNGLIKTTVFADQPSETNETKVLINNLEVDQKNIDGTSLELYRNSNTIYLYSIKLNRLDGKIWFTQLNDFFYGNMKVNEEYIFEGLCNL